MIKYPKYPPTTYTPTLSIPTQSTPTRNPPTTYTPENFDRSRLINNRWMLPEGMRSYQTPANAQQMWYNGQYGYIPFSDTVGGRSMNTKGYYTGNFVPYQQQPIAAPDFIRNPQQYQQQQLIQQYQKAMEDARAATESRYQQALSNLEGVGTQERADINSRYNSAGSAVNQSMVSSGLSGTTVTPTMQMGVERERTSALSRLSADLAREKNAIIASRNDIPPDLQLLAQLMFQAGAGGF